MVFSKHDLVRVLQVDLQFAQGLNFPSKVSMAKKT